MRKTIIGFVLVFSMIFPISVLAVEFTIPNAEINAFLKPNGDVEVIERFTYDLTGEFNGLSRELIPKKGASIKEFEAIENEVVLRVELEGGEYRIHRKGKSEIVHVELRYVIRNGMEKYEDGAQFYWPFFDNRNETDYGDMTIKVHPPAPAKDVLFLGYDAAYTTAKLEADGVVSFNMGKVSSGKNGDIRVVYEHKLFPNIIARKGLIREEFIAEEKQQAEEMASLASKEKNIKLFGLYGLPVIFLSIAGLFCMIFTKRRDGKSEVLYELKDQKSLVPYAMMSMPAIVYYTNGSRFSPEMVGASLLDLVRKENVIQHTDDKFEIINRDVDHTHELALLNFLFDDVGDGVYFKLGNLETYAKNKKNHIAYNIAMEKWREGIKKEVKEQQLVGKRKWVCVLFTLISITLAIATMFFANIGLGFLIVISSVFSFITLTFGILYKPRNKNGHLLFEEWQRFRLVFRDSSMNEWNNLSMDDKFKAFTYSVGSQDKGFSKQFKQFIDAEKVMTAGSSAALHMHYNPALLNATFMNASENASTSSSSNGGSSSGGTGDGGGGSGAF